MVVAKRTLTDTLDAKELLKVLRAVKDGDFSARMRNKRHGVADEVAKALNGIITSNQDMTTELAGLGNTLGREGDMNQRASLQGRKGSWATCANSINSIIDGLVQPTIETTRIMSAIAKGDLSQAMLLEVDGKPMQGLYLQMAETVNGLVGQLKSLASEVTRVSQEVGTEGKLGGQAEVKGVSGVWKDLTDNVNSMASNLTGQVRSIAEVTTAVATGDLSKKITVEAQGEVLKLRDTINTMVDQLSSFAGEVTRVAREVGTDGKLGGQAEVKGVSGVWKDLTDNVNFMASNLTGQVRNIAEVTTAVANGDLTRTITVEAKGEILKLRTTMNIMVDQLSSFAEEVTRVAREVGTEGKLGGQARVKGVSGVWKDLTDSVNLMASNLTGQVRNIAEVTTAVATGNLSKKITVDAQGEILELKDTINTMVDQLSSFGEEVTRVAREVGTEGKLGGQAQVRDVSGIWKELTDSVNFMASNLTDQVRNIAEVTTAVANGELTRKITVDAKGEILELRNTINTMVEQLGSFASEVNRIAREVGTDGKLGGQAEVKGVAGVWKDLTDNVNFMAGNLTGQVRNIAEVTTAVANGELTRKITVDAKGEILELRNTINLMVDQLSSFASEVTRIAREVGTDGKLGGQAQVKDVAGVWKDLTDSVNSMAKNLTEQVRGIAGVVTAVANGDLAQKLTVEASGEVAALADTINKMVETLSLFAAQVTSVAREVGVEGKLGGQAVVPGAFGIWKDLTANVNQLAGNLTIQVRAIGEVATAVTKGDLTRSIAVEASGEVELLKNNLNEMIGTLKTTTKTNTEQDWLKTNLAKFTRMLQGQRDVESVSKLILSELAPLVSAQHGVFYMRNGTNGNPVLTLAASYAYKERKNISRQYAFGEGLVGQCAIEKQRITITEVPDDYIQISSGLGEAKPMNLVMLPMLFEKEVLAVIELASFQRFNETQLIFLDQLAESIGIVLNTIGANARTEDLLKKSQSMSEELQSQQEELKQTNEELEEKAGLLVTEKSEVERKNRAIEEARLAVEEKAEQLTLTSKYKSEFLANMSHELRTPLNSLLILADVLSSNKDGNLSDKQIEFATTIHSSGNDLLALINEILDLAKIEAGTMDVEAEDVLFSDLEADAERNFRQGAQKKGLGFAIEMDANLPKTIRTDSKRLRQVLKNLLSNAFKFTEGGKVALRMAAAKQGWSPINEVLNRAQAVIAFAVSDTGIGIPLDKQKVIFEAFQQADGTTSRQYGGTGLGLSISREISRLLGGEIHLESAPGEGSTFTLYLPLTYGPAMPVDPAAGTRRAELRPEAGAFPPATAVPGDKTAVPPSFKEDEIGDDRNTIAPNDRVLLIVEDDIPFAKLLMEVGREKGFKCLLALKGEAGIKLAHDFKPAAITLDIGLPGMDGWTILDRLKHDGAVRHIPVHVISSADGRRRALEMGALAFLQKPVSKEMLDETFVALEQRMASKVRKLLIVEDDDVQSKRMVELMASSDVEVTVVGTGKDALAALQGGGFDCMVLDLELPDMTGAALLNKVRTELKIEQLPTIIYTAKDLTKKEETELRSMAGAIVVKGVQTPERLLDETALFLHRVEADLPADKRQMIKQVHDSDPVLAGRKVLIVDDDMRNIFAVTSVLEGHGMIVTYAESGKAGIEALKSTPGVELVLMDIMMPEMDGYEAMRAIRKVHEYETLPILALTAKVMKGDREKCIEAGASDYIPKPVDTNQLLSLLRVWLYRTVGQN